MERPRGWLGVRRIRTRPTLIPASRKTSRGRLVPKPLDGGSARASVAGAVVRGVAVAPRTPPEDALGEGAGVTLVDGAGVSMGDGVGVTLADGIALGELLGPEVGGVLGLGDGQAGTVLEWITDPSENLIR